MSIVVTLYFCYFSVPLYFGGFSALVRGNCRVSFPLVTLQTFS